MKDDRERANEPSELIDATSVGPPSLESVFNVLTRQTGERPPIGTALLFTRDYHPHVPFRVLGNLPATITVAILDEPPDGVQVLSQPDDYNGYVITYEIYGTPIYTFLFTRQFLPTGDRLRLGEDATYFSTNLNLLEVSILQA
ncbi:hypothetical protein ACFFQF_09200 [Haladaptatus pallidirubidus]|uniref:Uncharacterized protein n=1 Tax=Haladaptatus pallidirubidus TaxID=1008152 RepID=A0AAV3UG44_9EURY|nr:hypothetical protein [Haladaptatus pallidirubidus]